MSIIGDTAIKIDICLIEKNLDICTNKPPDNEIVSCLNDAVGDYINKTELNDLLIKMVESRDNIPIYHKDLIDEIEKRFIVILDFNRVIHENKRNLLKFILGQQIYAEQNPFVALCYVKRVESIVKEILNYAIACFTLMKYLNDNAQDMEAKDIDTSIHQVSQCKKTLETSVTAYKDAVKTKKLGNIDSLITRIRSNIPSCVTPYT
ncbi:hypothetical protein RF11_10859 [Thelohanellus kitauei]|uniref:Uncharacterized protein n=1 Tax=Thelohanellus kitauei TaxID=669202 RepID=A0A0C2MA25_THEKT|nr:hypothetical protein RF11_10859 [Thelohanellus kitauei]